MKNMRVSEPTFGWEAVVIFGWKERKKTTKDHQQPLPRYRSHIPFTSPTTVPPKDSWTNRSPKAVSCGSSVFGREQALDVCVGRSPGLASRATTNMM